MNRYEKWFLTKCAEYGIDGRELLDKMDKNNIRDENGRELLRVKRQIDKEKKDKGQINYRARRKISDMILGGILAQYLVG